ncbi:MAG: c-type cytochrome, partial [Rickettsiales bacterium]|nr:c-type cytochrome [Rickettsiales bacterium]
MKGLDFNKLAAGVLVAGVIAMVAGFTANGLYQPPHSEERGFRIEVVANEAYADEAEAAAHAEKLDIAALLSAADAEAGKAVAKKCAACHVFEKGGPNRVGPRLWGIVGANKAHTEDFSYSKALKEAGGTWDY